MRRSHKKSIANFLLFIFLSQIFSPIAGYALTGGPSQPEVQSFEPAGTSEMVDLFTGDFNYNIPLLDVGGYPINIAYHSGVSMDQEASWVGLGWNINPGVINRNMRGIPDEFDGDVISSKQYMKPEYTIGANMSLGFELFGLPMAASFGEGVFYNNYKGLGSEVFMNAVLAAGNHLAITAGLNSNSQKGLTASTGVQSRYSGFSSEIGINVNARTGQANSYIDAKFLGIGYGKNYNLNTTSYTPIIGNSYSSKSKSTCISKMLY